MQNTNTPKKNSSSNASDASSKTFYLLLCTLVFAGLAILTFVFFPQEKTYALAFGALTVISSLTWLTVSVLGKRERGESLRSVVYTSNAIFSFIVAVGFLGALNFIAVKREWKKDVTRVQSNTLSEQSLKILKDLPQEVQFLGLMRDANLELPARDLVEQFRIRSGNKIKAEFINPAMQPLLAMQHGVTPTRPNIIVVSVGEAKRTVEITSANNLEELLLNAMIQLVKQGKKKVYFLTGHGEKSLLDKSPGSLEKVKTSLEQSVYETAELSLVEQPSVPSDASLLVIAGPKRAPLAPEIKALVSYLEKFGDLLFLADPDTASEWNQILAGTGIKLTNRTVVENNPNAQKMAGSPLFPFVVGFNRTTDFGKEFSVAALLRLAAEVEIQSEKLPAGVRVEWQAKTTPSSFSSSKLDPQAKTFKMGAGDQKGPIIVAASSVKSSQPAEPVDPHGHEQADKKKDEEKKEKRETRVLVIGDSDFATNGALVAGNPDLFLNSVSWVAEDTDLISVRPRAVDESKIEMNAAQIWIVSLTNLILVPLALFIAAFVIYRRRLAL